MTHIFYVPHADDEVLSLGVAILQCLDRGEQVHLVLMTDGSACGSIHFLNGTEKCPVHGVYHDPIKEGYRDGILDTQEHVAARRREFLDASAILGVPTSNLHVYGYKDGKLTVEQARQVVLRMHNSEELSGPKTHHTLTERYDDHNDHKACGRALADLHAEGLIGQPYWYVKRWLWETLPSDAPITDIVAEDSQAARLRKAIEDVYKNWDPQNGHYAVGYHSVAKSFDGTLKDFRNRRHEKP